MGVHVKVAGAWQEIGGGAGTAGIPWAVVTGGTVTTVNNPDGSVDEVHTFTANGTLTVDSPGYARVFMISGGSGGAVATEGAGGRIVSGIHSLAAGALPVVVGAGGGGMGKASSIGALTTYWAANYWGGAGATSEAGAGATNQAGVVDDITGAAVEYGKGGQAAPAVNRGEGRNAGGSGSTGVVIVRVQTTPPTVSGVVASGGTESTYVGDGVNGVLGQSYKVHTFTASGTLTVTQGGECDVLVCSGGGWASSNAGGGGGGVYMGRVTLAGAMPVTVGPAATTGVPPASSAFAGISPSGGGPATGTGHGGGGGAGGVATYAGGGAGGPYVSQNVGGPGVISRISGSAVEYGRGGNVGGGNLTTPGAGAVSTGTAQPGVVIVRYKVAA